MKYENEIFTIEYNEYDKEYISEAISIIMDNYKRIMDFFGLFTLDKKVVYKFWNSIDEFREFFVTNGWNYQEWIVGKYTSTKDTNHIDCLSLKERIKAKGHYNDSVDILLIMMVHELVHACHNQYKNYSLSLTYVSEGLATNLSNQYSDYSGQALTCSLDDLLESKHTNYSNYYLIIKYVLNNYNHEYVLRISRDKEFCIQETPRLYEETNKWLYNSKNKLVI